jgi:hypothetical protein
MMTALPTRYIRTVSSGRHKQRAPRDPRATSHHNPLATSVEVIVQPSGLSGCGSHRRVVSNLGQWFRSSALHFCEAADTSLEVAGCGQMDQMAERYAIGSGGSTPGSSSEVE